MDTTTRFVELVAAVLRERADAMGVSGAELARAAADSDVSVPLPDDWEVSLAARRVDDSPEAREDAFLNSLGEEPQE